MGATNARPIQRSAAHPCASARRTDVSDVLKISSHEEINSAANKHTVPTNPSSDTRGAATSSHNFPPAARRSSVAAPPAVATAVAAPLPVETAVAAPNSGNVTACTNPDNEI